MTSTMIELFKQDVQRWVVPSKVAHPSAVTLRTTVKLLYRHRPLRAMLWFRVGSWCKQKHIPGLPGILQRRIMHQYGLEILVGADIGGGLYIAHPVGCVIAPGRMGRNCSVIASATIGMRNEWEFPVIGDNVFIGAGARVLGGIRVGDNASIGANAVVIHDVPDGATAVGVPAHTNGQAVPA
jgi:serine O-acetyltransferase